MIVEKRMLWEKLLYLKSIFTDEEWVIGGDFNTVKNGIEKKGRSGVNRRSEWTEFLEFIDKSNLIDIPSKGKKFAWFGGDGMARSRIDRFLVADTMVSRWGIVGQLARDHDISDHCPIWLIGNNSNWGSKPFKVNNKWFSNKDFLSFVEKEWLELKVEGRGDFVLKEKLRRLKERLRWWNVNIFGRFDLAVEKGVRVLNEGDEMVDDDEDLDELEDISVDLMGLERGGLLAIFGLI
ncbi:uncharacterized protein LOC131604879 [Vicia villosa]|uniref:uncharacterized protein LOC131604879 n=1 Tax=Vicia villosa TaxID=3911 RepID=UPI00273BAB4C|nr:uncharacterized protein LOC131604879 [Vicia villosa]